MHRAAVSGLMDVARILLAHGAGMSTILIKSRVKARRAVL